MAAGGPAAVHKDDPLLHFMRVVLAKCPNREFQTGRLGLDDPDMIDWCFFRYTSCSFSGASSELLPDWPASPVYLSCLYLAKKLGKRILFPVHLSSLSLSHLSPSFFSSKIFPKTCLCHTYISQIYLVQTDLYQNYRFETYLYQTSLW